MRGSISASVRTMWPCEGRRQKRILAFLARDADARVFCYPKVKRDHSDEILRVAAAWKDQSGNHPRELVFDSTLTPFAGLAQLHRLSIDFLTLRRRTKKILAAFAAAPGTDWQPFA